MNLKRASINGEFLANCMLDSYPTFTVFFNIPNEFDDYALHRCAIDSEINLQREKILEFVPPNGKTVILSYR